MSTDDDKVRHVDFRRKRLISEAERLSQLEQKLADGTLILHVLPDGKKLFIIPGKNGDVFVSFPLLQIHDGVPHSFLGLMSDEDEHVLHDIYAYLREKGLLR